jgi:hypothetical protein
MSLTRPTCEKCKVEMQFDRSGPFPADSEKTYAVAWKCPECAEIHLIINSVGPLIPKPEMCLNCGATEQAYLAPCSHCGFRPTDALGLEDQLQTDEVLLKLAQHEFWIGTCARGMYIVNFLLARNPNSAAAWSVKQQVLEQLGFQNAAKEAALEADSRRLPSPLLSRIWAWVRGGATG